MTDPIETHKPDAPLTGPDPLAVDALEILALTPLDQPLPDAVIDWMRASLLAALFGRDEWSEAFRLKGSNGHADGLALVRGRLALRNLHEAADILAPGAGTDDQAKAVLVAFESIHSGRRNEVDQNAARLMQRAQSLRAIPTTKKRLKPLLKRERGQETEV